VSPAFFASVTFAIEVHLDCVKTKRLSRKSSLLLFLLMRDRGAGIGYQSVVTLFLRISLVEPLGAGARKIWLSAHQS